MSIDRYLNATEAAERLNISLATLYAYVSRGLIRSEASAEGSRQRRYYAEDVEKLLARKEGRANPEKLAQDALHWGAPILESALTLIESDRHYYRGYDALALSDEASIEEVAALIWTGQREDAARLFDPASSVSSQPYETMLLHIEVDGASLKPLQAAQVLLTIAASDDLSAYDLRPASVAQTGARILRLLASTFAGNVPDSIPVAAMLQRGLAPQHEIAERLFNSAMILCADHELNASSFTARVVASAEATPYAVVLAGLSALQGIKHGGHTERVEALLREIGDPGQVGPVLASRLRRGEVIPGFGHQLYPQGDPRARHLLKQLDELLPDSPQQALIRSLVEKAQETIGEPPTIDLALVALARSLGLHADDALAIFALGRSIGWVGHAMEQYEAGWLIRPRARYTGDQPRR